LRAIRQPGQVCGRRVAGGINWTDRTVPARRHTDCRAVVAYFRIEMEQPHLLARPRWRLTSGSAADNISSSLHTLDIKQHQRWSVFRRPKTQCRARAIPRLSRFARPKPNHLEPLPARACFVISQACCLLETSPESINLASGFKGSASGSLGGKRLARFGILRPRVLPQQCVPAIDPAWNPAGP